MTDYNGYMSVMFPGKAFRGDAHFEGFARAVKGDPLVGPYVDHWAVVKKGGGLPDGKKAKRKTCIMVMKCGHHVPHGGGGAEHLTCKKKNLQKLRDHFVPFFQEMLLRSVRKGMRTMKSVSLVRYDLWET